MSSDAIQFTTEALRRRIADALRERGEPKIHVGPPLAQDMGDAKASVFLFHVRVNAELRNEPHYEATHAMTAATAPANICNALPLDLRYLITAFPQNGFNELETLGKIIEALHVQPTLSGAQMEGQFVRVTFDPYPMEEISRVWSLFPHEVYRTSLVYLASPVFIEAGRPPQGPPVRRREQHSGILEAQPDLAEAAP